MKKPFLSRLSHQLKSRFRFFPTPKSLAKNLALPALAGGVLAFAHQAFAQVGAAPATIPVASPEIKVWEALVLGLVQGLTEFIPVSSSGHLNITHALMSHPRELAYDVLLSVGTTLAVAWYFRHDWKALLTDPAKRALRNLVFLSCVPAVLFAPIIHPFQDKEPIASAQFNALMMIVFGAILLASDKMGKKTRDVSELKARDAWLIGVGQAIALIPGVSRSGATMTAGLFLGFKREDAARFSFLMSLPINIGAVLFKAKDFGEINASVFSMIVGVVASAISGFWAIGFLLNYLKSKDVTPFFVWRVAVGLLVFAYFSR